MCVLQENSAHKTKSPFYFDYLLGGFLETALSFVDSEDFLGEILLERSFCLSAVVSCSFSVFLTDSAASLLGRFVSASTLVVLLLCFEVIVSSVARKVKRKVRMLSS